MSQKLIKNSLAKSLLEMAGKDRVEVLGFLKARAAVEKDPEELKNVESFYKCSNRRADWYCTIVDISNRRPVVTIAGVIFLVYNVIWWSMQFVKKFI